MLPHILSNVPQMLQNSKFFNVEMNFTVSHQRGQGVSAKPSMDICLYEEIFSPFYCPGSKWANLIVAINDLG